MKVIIISLCLFAIVFADSDRDFVPILRDDRIQTEEGSYSFDIETGDGIVRSESGGRLEHLESQPIGQQGEVSFTFPNGELFQLKFVADEFGYKPESPYLPVAPAFPHPIPQFVLDQIEKARLEDEEEARTGKKPEYNRRRR